MVKCLKECLPPSLEDLYGAPPIGALPRDYGIVMDALYTLYTIRTGAFIALLYKSSTVHEVYVVLRDKNTGEVGTFRVSCEAARPYRSFIGKSQIAEF